LQSQRRANLSKALARICPLQALTLQLRSKDMPSAQMGKLPQTPLGSGLSQSLRSSGAKHLPDTVICPAFSPGKLSASPSRYSYLSIIENGFETLVSEDFGAQFASFCYQQLKN